MNTSYGSFNFTGGWQDDQSAESDNYLESSLLGSPDGQTDAAGNLQGPSTASSSDEWGFAHSSWPQQSILYDGALAGDFDNFDAFAMYTTAPGYAYDADTSELSDLNQCQSQSSFSESDFDFDHLHTAYYGGTDCRTNSFSSLPLASPTREAIYQPSPTSAYISPNQQAQAQPPQLTQCFIASTPFTSHHYQQQPQPPPLPSTTAPPPTAPPPTAPPPTGDLTPTSPLHPRPQSARFTGDLYTPPYVRGDGPTRAGWCTLCATWHTLKDSAYWYHMHFAHGISCATGKSMPVPLRSRLTAGAARGVGDSEALCGFCGQWVLVVAGEKGRTAWWRHAYRCKFKQGGGVGGGGGGGSAVLLGRERRRGKSASPRKVVARPAGRN